MKKLLFAVIILLACCGCEKDDADLTNPTSKISFVTSRKVGGTIAVTFDENELPAKVIGAIPIHEEAIDMDGGIFMAGVVEVTYELTAQTVIIEGDFTGLRCSENDLTSLDVSQCPHLSYLDCGSNELTVLDLSKNVELKNIACCHNKLATLDVSKNSELEILACYNNQLTVLDLSNNKKLLSLSCYLNDIKADNMLKLTNSLRQIPLDEPIDPWVYYSARRLYLYVASAEEGNELPEAAIKIAEDKNWEVYRQQ